jgi:hypothetical protein
MPLVAHHIETEPKPSEKPKVHAGGRRCPGCGKLLSRYNVGPRCYPCREEPEKPHLWVRGPDRREVCE